MIEGLGGTVFHSTAWAEYQREVQGGEPVFIQAHSESGAPLGAALGMYRRSRNPILGVFLRRMETASYPIAAGVDPGLTKMLLLETERAARKLGCARLTIGSNFSGDTDVALDSLGYATQERVEFVVDLTAAEDALWNAIKKDQRDRIRRLARDGVEYETTTLLEGMQELDAVRQTALERRLERDQGFSLPSDAHYYEQLHRTLVARGAARLLLARQGGAVVAAILYSTFCRKAYSIFSGSTEAGYDLSAQTGLFWHAVKTLKREGFHVLNRGGVPAAAARDGHELHGIYRFKHRLGTTAVQCVSGEKVLNAVKDGIVRLREFARREGV
jgi:lipid II:glycine glycyltransferase (peptidoglycan interpeptide bridge formation enzyme)